MPDGSVSVVIPAFNGARFLARGLESVVGQGVPDVEVVVVDDGSTDGTGDVVRGFGRGVRLIGQENRGAGAARNAGIRATSGRYVAFLDADDEWLPGKLARQLALLRANPDVALVSGGAIVVDEDGRETARRSASERGRVVRRLLLENFIVTSSVVVERRALEDLDGPFRTTIRSGQDWELWLRVAGRHPILVDPECVVRYRVRQDSLYHQHSAQQRLQICRGIYEELEREPELAPILRECRAALRGHVHFIAAAVHYEKGESWAARREVLRSIAASPATVRWDSALSMLLLPPGVQSRLRKVLRG